MTARILVGDCIEQLRTLPSESVHCVVTSPPYWGLRDYGDDRQIGLELSPDDYVARLVDVFRQVRRVLRRDGTLWLNIGDSYAGTTGLVAEQLERDSILIELNPAYAELARARVDDAGKPTKKRSKTPVTIAADPGATERV